MLTRVLALRPLLLEPFPRDPSQEEAKRELSKEIYREHRSFIDEVLDWISRKIAEVLDSTSATQGNGSLLLGIVLLLVVGLIIAVLVRFGPVARGSRRRSDEAAHLEPIVDDVGHRRLADGFAAEGRYAEAVRERLRAIIANLIERDVLEDRRGRTAAEIAAAAGRKLPTVAGDLREAAELFGAIWYGRRTATAAHDDRMRAIDRAVSAARPNGSKPALAGAATWAVPSAGPPEDER